MNAKSGIIFFKLFQTAAAKIVGYFFDGIYTYSDERGRKIYTTSK